MKTKTTIRNQRSTTAFTLIELLVVIAIIAIIAALLLPVANHVVNVSLINHAESERDQLETAIESYHSHFGYYPPSNGAGTQLAALTNQLYYELSGTTSTNGSSFTTLDNLSTITTGNLTTYFNINGIMNCNRGSGDDAIVPKGFLPDLKPAQVGTQTNLNNNVTCVIVTAVHSDSIYNPMPGFGSRAGYPANPWRYLYPGTNNPSSYDLWIQVYVGGKTNLICNWFNQPKVNYPIP
jgi:prepilin-type N-terminal cleavage/methylation domain-containing protein